MNYSGLFDGVYGTPYAALNADKYYGTPSPAEPQLRRTEVDRLRKSLKRIRDRKLRAQIATNLVMYSTGERTAAIQHRVKAQSNDAMSLGGVREIEAHTLYNGHAADSRAMTLGAALSKINDAVFVADKSGNGGGGKLGY